MPATNRQFGKMAGSVLNSTAVLRLNSRAKLNICASISATSPSCKTVSGQATSDRAKNEQTTLNKIWTQEKELSTTFLTETEF